MDDNHNVTGLLKLVQLSSNTRTFFKPVKLDLYKSIYMVSPYPD